MAGPKRGFLAAVYLISCWIVSVSPANYQFQLQKIEKTEGNACDMTGIKLANLNNDLKSLYGPVTIQRDVPNSTVVNLTGYEKKRNGQYTRNMFLTKNNLSICTLMSKNTDAINEMVGNVPSSCPIQAGTYNFNYTADTKRLPNTIPFDSLKVTIEAKAGTEVLCKHDAYINIMQNKTNQQSRQKG